MSAQPAVIGRYTVLRRLGAGAMGEVYLARDPSLDRTVAIKLLLYEEREDLRRRFFVEARSAGTLNHPNIVTIHDLGEHEGRPYLVMEYVFGQTLAALIDRQSNADTSSDTTVIGPPILGALSLPRRLRFVEELCAGLGAAHRAGIVHRDVKPANLMIDQRDERRPTLKILDFGIARVMDASALRMTKGPLGTPRYMAPEQYLANDYDVRADIFSAGAVMYELLTYVPAFQGATYAQILWAVCHSDPAPLGQVCPDLGQAATALEAILRQALAKDVARRYQSIEEMREEVEQVRLTVASTPTPLPPRPEPTPLPPRPAEPSPLPPRPAEPLPPPPQVSEPLPIPAPTELPPPSAQAEATVAAPQPVPVPQVATPAAGPRPAREAQRRRRGPTPRAWLAVAGTAIVLAVAVFGAVEVFRWRQSPAVGQPGQTTTATPPRDAAPLADESRKAAVEPPPQTTMPAAPPAALPAAPQSAAGNAASRTPPAAERRALPVEEKTSPVVPAQSPPAAPKAPSPAPAPKTPALDAANTLAAAQDAFDTGDYARALTRVNSVLKADPANQSARALRDRVASAQAAEVRRLMRSAETAFNAGDYDTAISTLGKALTVDAGNSAAAELLAKVRSAKAAEERRRREPGISQGARQSYETDAA